MSWNSYVDNLIARTKFADQACIVGLDGSIWSESTGENSPCLSISIDEAAAIASIMRTNDYSPFQTNGITISGLKYTFIKNEDKAIYGKKTGSGGISLQATNQAIVIGHCVEGGQQGDVNNAVFKVADYLESQGF